MRAAADVRDLRELIKAAGSPAHVIAKIEKAEARRGARRRSSRETDAIMVARGDLGVEIGPALVPLIQKRIILRALEAGKPVITATQMLESMVHHPEPTRAEASDVANAILDGTTAVMLSGETAVGEYPVEAVQTMDRIALAVEPSLDYRHEIPEASDEPDRRPGDVERRLRPRRGARRLRDPRPDLHRPHRLRGRAAAAPPSDRRAHPPRVVGAADGARVGRDAGADPRGDGRRGAVAGVGRAAAREAGIVEPGDRIVITAGTAVNMPGSTNVIKVEIA